MGRKFSLLGAMILITSIAVALAYGRHIAARNDVAVALQQDLDDCGEVQIRDALRFDEFGDRSPSTMLFVVQTELSNQFALRLAVLDLRKGAWQTMWHWVEKRDLAKLGLGVSEVPLSFYESAPSEEQLMQFIDELRAEKNKGARESAGIYRFEIGNERSAANRCHQGYALIDSEVPHGCEVPQVWWTVGKHPS